MRRRNQPRHRRMPVLRLESDTHVLPTWRRAPGQPEDSTPRPPRHDRGPQRPRRTRHVGARGDGLPAGADRWSDCGRDARLGHAQS